MDVITQNARNATRDIRDTREYHNAVRRKNMGWEAVPHRRHSSGGAVLTPLACESWEATLNECPRNPSLDRLMDE